MGEEEEARIGDHLTRKDHVEIEIMRSRNSGRMAHARVLGQPLRAALAARQSSGDSEEPCWRSRTVSDSAR